jgi:tRNA/tmRNA/rRNA uracil-C5-methylase (TrmA/RlmC/RlmD family)
VAADAPDRVELVVGAPAAGGACVARHEGRVVFVRHTLPGERVMAHVTGVGGGGRFWFADAVEVLSPATGRVSAPCPFSGPGGCGGCDYQHVDLAVQRRWKADIVAEQLRRLGGVEVAVDAAAVPGDDYGLGWRTRVRYAVDSKGGTGFRAHRSRRVVAVDRCRIATAAVQHAEADGVPVTAGRWDGCDEVVVVQHADGVLVQPQPGPPSPEVSEEAVGRRWLVAGDGFWQVHPGAAAALADLVVAHCTDSRAVWDLYSGVGLFAGALGAADDSRRIAAVEGDRRAAALARANLADLRGVRVWRSDVRRWLARPPGGRPDTVVLDPPRKGAGAEVMRLLDDSGAERMVYIACDPASLGRDTGPALRSGWRLEAVQALDIFPMTHHVETVALFRR